MSVIDEIREYVENEKNLRNGKTRTFSDGKERTFICNEEGFIDGIIGKKYGNIVSTNYVFAQEMEITRIYSPHDIAGRSFDKIWLGNIIFLTNINFSGVKFESKFIMEIESADTVTLSFVDCHIADKFKIRNVESYNYEQEQQNKAKIGEINFIGCSMAGSSEGKVSYLRCGFLDVDKFFVKNIRIPVDAELNIGDCRFKDFALSNIRNLGKLKLYRINSLKEEEDYGNAFQLDNTSIGDADFQSLNLAAFDSRKIFDNILQGIKYSNVRWESSHDFDVDQFEDNTVEMEKKRDTYRSLKIVAKQNDDQPQALAFYAKEMKYHREVIKLTTKRYRLDRVILLFNHRTNNFGQNWMLPIGLILGFGAISYALLLCALQQGPFNLTNWDKFPMFLNPTHATKFIGTAWGFWAYTIDLIFRAVEGSLIYQTIQAFRRYSRNI